MQIWLTFVRTDLANMPQSCNNVDSIGVDTVDLSRLFQRGGGGGKVEIGENEKTKYIAFPICFPHFEVI